jgi:hypothetical protein
MRNSERVLPDWFTERMAKDMCAFGLVMSNGNVIGVHSIESVSQAADGTIWLDVRLLHPNDCRCTWLDYFAKGWFAPTTNLLASINASHVMAAFELADH